MTKVVASRKVTLESDTPFDSTSIIGRLVAQNQGAFIFAYNKGDAVFLGASPEVLVRKRGQDFMSYALAGTMKKDDIHDQGARLLADAKNRYEHNIVVDMIKATMSDLCDRVEVKDTHIMELPNLYHLRTLLYGHDTEHSILTMAKAFIRHRPWAVNRGQRRWPFYSNMSRMNGAYMRHLSVGFAGIRHFSVKRATDS